MSKALPALWRSCALLLGLTILQATALAQSIACEDLNASVDANCNADITPAAVLAGDPVPGTVYTIMIKTGRRGRILEAGTPGAPFVRVDGVDPQGQRYDYIGRRLVAEISNGNNSCWSFVTFEDKLAPSFGAVEDVTLTCLDDLSCVAFPEATDNCDAAATVNLTGTQTLSGDICAPGGQVIQRTFIAFDDQGNISAPVTQTITITQAPLVFPRDIEFTCEQYACYPSITDATERSACIFDTVDDDDDGTFSNADDDDDDTSTPFSQADDIITVGLQCGFDDGTPACTGAENDTQNGLGCDATLVCNLSAAALPPNTNQPAFTCALPQVAGLEDDDVLATTGAGTPNVFQGGGGSCMYLTTFEDDTLAACGGAPGVFKILRAWTVLNWCTSEVETDIQVIKVIDRTPPTLEVPATVTLNANVGANSGTGGNGNSGNGVCASSGLLPLPTVSDACSGVDLADVTVSTPAGQATPFVDQNSGQVVGFSIPAPFLPFGGPYTITYRVSDACGNEAVATTQVTVEDITPPVPVCDEITAVGLTTTPNSAVFADDLDDGSFDNCGDVFFKVIRLDELNAGDGNAQGRTVGCDDANSEDRLEGANTVAFDDEAFFCCEDIATNPNLVIVRVFDVDPGPGAVAPIRIRPGGDLFGRFNDCVVEVNVNDNLGPQSLCRPDVTLACGDPQIAQFLDPDGLTFEAPVFADVCDVDVTLSVTDGLDPMCNTGTITRTFTALDASGNSAICVQRVTVTPVADYSVTFPDDVLVECGQTSAVAGDRDDVITTQGPCDNVVISQVDQDFELFSTGDTAKIIRCYTVLNWCENPNINVDPTRIANNPNVDAGATLTVFDNGSTVSVTATSDPNLPNVATGYFEYCQVIKFESTDPAVITGEFSDCDGGTQLSDTEFGCTTQVVIDIDAVAGCAPIAGFDYFVVLDIDNQAPFSEVTAAELATGTSYEGNGDGDPFGGLTAPDPTFEAQVTGNYPLGQHVIVVTPQDGSNQQTLIPFVATDCVSPSISRNLAIEIPIVQNILTGEGEAVITFADVARAIEPCGATFDSIRLASGNFSDPFFTSVTVDCSVNPVFVDVKALDEAGGFGFQPQIEVTLVDPDMLCPSFRAAVGGTIGTVMGEDFPNVRVGVAGDYFGNATTDAAGAYAFPDVTLGDSVSIDPYYNDGLANGVTSLDYYFIGRHVLGYELLDTPEKLIAADINNSGQLTAFDLTALRRVVLGIDTEFPNGQTSWRFVDADYVFPDATNPWAEIWPEVVTIDGLAEETLDADFRAIKIGDIDGSAAMLTTPLGPRSRTEQVVLRAEDAVLAAGERARVDVSTDDVEALGYQLTLEWDPTQLRVRDIAAGAHEAAGFGTHLLAEGKLTLAHVGDLRGLLFALDVEAVAPGVRVSEALRVTSSVTEAIAFGPDAAAGSVRLAFGQAESESFAATLSQNRPNPFTGETQIDFVLAEAGEATLTVRDLAGRVVYTHVGDYPAGPSTLRVGAAELRTKGVLSYTLTAGAFTATRRMVVVD